MHCILILYILSFASLSSITPPSLAASEGWAATYGGVGEDWAAFIRQTCDGGYIVAGWTASFGVANGDLWVLKLKPDGSIDPSCDFVRDTIISEIGSDATILDTRASIKESNANPQDSSATILDTSVSAKILCSTASYYYGKPP